MKVKNKPMGKTRQNTHKTYLGTNAMGTNTWKWNITKGAEDQHRGQTMSPCEHEQGHENIYNTNKMTIENKTGKQTQAKRPKMCKKRGKNKNYKVQWKGTRGKTKVINQSKKWESNRPGRKEKEYQKYN